MAGGGIRILVHFWIGFLHIGNFVLELSTPQVFNTQLAFTKTWFEPEVRGLYAGIVRISVCLGVGVGSVQPQLLPITWEDEPTKESIKHNIFWYMASFEIFYIVIGILNIIFFNEGPLCADVVLITAKPSNEFVFQVEKEEEGEEENSKTDPTPLL